LARYSFPVPGRDPYGSDDAPLKPSLRERLSGRFLKPVDPDAAAAATSAAAARSVDELESVVKYADDKERLLGLLAAPLAAALGILVINLLIAHDPTATLANGQANAKHVSLSLYHELDAVLLVLSVLMLAMAWFRKRLFLGMVMALYGLAVFNLHYWGFGIPFVLGGSWLLVRAYRAQKDLRLATGDLPSGRNGTSSIRPKANKRYTPPT
jgi:hypothetical protein